MQVTSMHSPRILRSARSTHTYIHTSTSLRLSTGWKHDNMHFFILSRLVWKPFSFSFSFKQLLKTKGQKQRIQFHFSFLVQPSSQLLTHTHATYIRHYLDLLYAILLYISVQLFNSWALPPNGINVLRKGTELGKLFLSWDLFTNQHTRYS